MGIGDEIPFLDNPEAKFTEMNRRAKEEVERRRKADERAAALRAAIHQASASAPSTPSGGNQGRAQSPFRAPSPGFVLPGQSPIPGPFRYPYKEMQEVEGNQGGDGPPPDYEETYRPPEDSVLSEAAQQTVIEATTAKNAESKKDEASEDSDSPSETGSVLATYVKPLETPTTDMEEGSGAEGQNEGSSEANRRTAWRAKMSQTVSKVSKFNPLRSGRKPAEGDKLSVTFVAGTPESHARASSTNKELKTPEGANASKKLELSPIVNRILPKGNDQELMVLLQNNPSMLMTPLGNDPKNKGPPPRGTPKEGNEDETGSGEIISDTPKAQTGGDTDSQLFETVGSEYVTQSPSQQVQGLEEGIQSIMKTGTSLKEREEYILQQQQELTKYYETAMTQDQEGKEDPSPCQRCKNVQVKPPQEMCKGCLKEVAQGQVKSSLAALAKIKHNPLAESTMLEGQEEIALTAQENLRAKERAEFEKRTVIENYCVKRMQEIKELNLTYHQNPQEKNWFRRDQILQALEKLGTDYPSLFASLGVEDLHLQASNVIPPDLVQLRRLYGADLETMVPLGLEHGPHSPYSENFRDTVLYQWIGQVKLIRDILSCQEMVEWIKTPKQELVNDMQEPLQSTGASARHFKLNLMARVLLYMKDLFEFTPGIMGPEEGPDQDEEGTFKFQARPVWNLQRWMDLVRHLESSSPPNQKEADQARRQARGTKMVLWQYIGGLSDFLKRYMTDSYTDIRQKIGAIAQKIENQTGESRILSAFGQANELTGMAKCAETLKEIEEWNTILRKLPIKGKPTTKALTELPKGFHHVTTESRYERSHNPSVEEELPRGIRKEYRDFTRVARHSKLDHDLSQVMWSAPNRRNDYNDNSDRTNLEDHRLNWVDQQKGRRKGPSDSSDESSGDTPKKPSKNGGGGRKGGGPPGGGPPDDDDDDDSEDSEDSSEETDTSTETESNHSKKTKKKPKWKCQRCGGRDHKTGSKSCPKRQKACRLCHRTTHDFRFCPFREDAPNCPECHQRVHENPKECPVRVERKRMREIKAYQKDPEELTPARYKARLYMGADLDGNPIIPHVVQPPAPAAAAARRLREFERQRAHEECDLEELIEHAEMVSKITLDLQIDEVKRQTIARAMKNARVKTIPELERLRPGVTRKIEEKTNELYAQKSLATSQGNSYKDVSIEQMGFDKDVVFHGVPGEKYPIKEFLERFDKAKYTRNWDPVMSAYYISGHLRGDARIFFENLKKDPRTKRASQFYPELKAHLLNRYYRELDVFTRARMMQNVTWDARRFNGSPKAYLTFIVNRSFAVYDGKPDQERVTWREVRESEAIDKFIRTVPRTLVQQMKHERVEETIEGFTSWLKEWEETQRITTDRFRQGPNLRVNAVGGSGNDQGAEGEEFPTEVDEGLLEYWNQQMGGGSEAAENSTTLEVNAVRRGPQQRIGPCHRCRQYGHLIRDCPEPEPEGEGLETQAVTRRRPGGTQSQGRQTFNSRNNKPRRGYTRVKRAQGGNRRSHLRKGKRYFSTDSSRTYRVAAISHDISNDDNVVIGALEDLDPENEGQERVEEMEHRLVALDEDEDPVITTNGPALESAAMRGPGPMPRGAEQLGRTKPPGQREKPEVAAVTLENGSNGPSQDPFGYDLGNDSFGSYDR